MEKIIASEDANHLQVDDFIAKDDDERSAFWQELRHKYPGYEIDFCFHNCEVPIGFMAEIGMELLESCLESRLVEENFNPVGECVVTPVSQENFSTFKALHDEMSPEMFWSGERIGQDLDRWRIFMTDEDYVLMSLWGDVSEIYALQVKNTVQGVSLLSAAAAAAFDMGKKSVLFMIGEGSNVEFDSAQSVGFKVVGKHIAYRGTVE